MVGPGNHEAYHEFVAFQRRFFMPSNASGAEEGNQYWSLNYSWMHMIFMSSECDFSPESKQFSWLLNDLKAVDRSKTPWLIVTFHRPIYNSNHAHQMEGKVFKSIYEPIFMDFGIDLVISGHVHAYERTYPVYKNNVTNDAPRYITIGDGGNHEGLEHHWYQRPVWSAIQSSQYGTSKTTSLNSIFRYDVQLLLLQDTPCWI